MVAAINITCVTGDRYPGKSNITENSKVYEIWANDRDVLLLYIDLSINFRVFSPALDKAFQISHRSTSVYIPTSSTLTLQTTVKHQQSSLPMTV